MATVPIGKFFRHLWEARPVVRNFATVVVAFSPNEPLRLLPAAAGVSDRTEEPPHWVE